MLRPGSDEHQILDIMNTVMSTPGNILSGQDGSMQAAPAQMSDSTLLNLINYKVESSHQWYGTGKLSSQRIKADQYYRGEPLGNEIQGRSQVVSRDVQEAVDGLMPNLMRVFASGDQVVIMEPSRPDAEEAAKQATDFINWSFFQQNEGFQVLYTWFKDALLKRNGIVKSWYETRTSRQKDSYEGLTESQYQAIKADPTIQVLSCETYPDVNSPPQPIIDPTTGQPAIDPQTGQMHMTPPAMLYNCVMMSAVPVKKLRIENVPPDEFIIERRAVSESTSTFFAHRRKETISDLLELGFPEDKVKAIPSGDDQEYTQERIERFAGEDSTPYSVENETLDPSMRKVWVTEAYLKVDYDGDGLAEWRKVTVAGDATLTGNAILSNEEIDDHPFATLTPIPDPHRFYGFSIYDQTNDIQEIKTALLRGSLDCIYLASSPRVGAVEGQVNLDDLLDSRVGGVVRLKNPNSLVPIPTLNASPQAMEMIGYMDQVREKRTGIAPAAAGLDPNILNSSATGANILDNNNQLRPELIARIFAETGVKRLFRRIFELTCTHEDKTQTVRLRGKWVDIDPRDWKGRMDVTVSVGIGLGDKTKQLNAVMMAMNLDEKIVTMQKGLNGPFLMPQNIYAKLEKFTEALGWKSVGPYYTNPVDAPPPPPPQPTPDQLHEMAMAQADIAVAQAKEKGEEARLAIQAQVDTNQSNLDAALAREKFQYEHELEKYKVDTDNETKIIVAQIAAREKSVDEGGNVINEPKMSDLLNVVKQELSQSLQSMHSSLAQVQQTNAAIAHHLSKPKRIITNDNGDITGVE